VSCIGKEKNPYNVLVEENYRKVIDMKTET
jgi:hypothetical protein